MALISRDQFREASKAALPTKRFTLNYPPELVGDVIVRAMGAKELTLFNESLFQGNGKKRKIVTINIQAKMAVRCILDEDGKRIFSDDDADWLGELRADAVGKIFKTIQDLTGLNDDDENEEGDTAGK